MRFTGRAVEAYRESDEMNKLKKIVIGKSINNKLFSSNKAKDFKNYIDTTKSILKKLNVSRHFNLFWQYRNQTPDAPKSKEKNWIPTVPGKAWFPYFRLYSPKKAFLDRTWVLPDIEKAG